jgi:hypothetical protein
LETPLNLRIWHFPQFQKFSMPLMWFRGYHFHACCPHAMAGFHAERRVLRDIALDRLSACQLNDDG